VTFSDSGKGIADTNREKIFEAFFTTKAKGTGLGLHLTKKMLQENGGEISLTQRANPTTFTIYLPKGVKS
jgi:two-component system NtrC family sensor kinase